ncbi:zinc knuckle CX2CX4HX4C containing protein [Tanacetum coccineum]
MEGVAVDTLTMEQYLALSRENQAPGVVKPEIGGNVNFKIKSQFMCELREDTFSGNKDEDAHDHIDRVLNIIGLFNILESLKMQSCSEFFPLLLPDPQKGRWTDSPQELSIPGISSKRHLSKGLGAGLSTMNRQLLDSHGPILGMRPAQTLTAIQTMADNSQKWHDRTTSRSIRSNSSNGGLDALVNKLDNLGRDMKKLKESVYEIQVGCQICEGPHLDRDCSLSEEVKQVEEVRNGGRQILAETVKKYIEEAFMRQRKQDEWLKTFCHNLEKSQNHHDEIIQDLKSRVTTLAKEIETKTGNNKDCKAIFTNDGAPLYTLFYYSPNEIEYFLANSEFSDDDEHKNVTSLPDKDLKQTTTHYIELYVPPIPFPMRLEQHAEEVLIHKTMESLKKIKSNRPFLKEIRQSDEYPKFLKDLEKDPGSFILPCSIGRLDFNNDLADLGASISIMPFSMYKRLGIGKLETIKMNIKLADNSKYIPKGIVRNLLIKIDKFILPIDFIILDVLVDYRMPVILGRPLLTTAHAKVDVFKRSISLEVGNEKVIFKLKSDLLDTKNESVLMIQSNIITEEDELMNIKSDLLTYNTNTCESCHILVVDTDLFTYEVVTQETCEEIAHKCCLTTQDAIGDKTKPILGRKKSHWCALIYQQNNGIQENDNNRKSIEWNDLSLNDWLKIKYGEVDEAMKNKILIEHWRKRFGVDYDDSDDFYDLDQCGEIRNNEIQERIIHNLHEEWFKRTSEDEDDIEGIIDYLEPTSYDGFVDLDEEEYNKR